MELEHKSFVREHLPELLIATGAVALVGAGVIAIGAYQRLQRVRGRITDMIEGVEERMNALEELPEHLTQSHRY